MAGGTYTQRDREASRFTHKLFWRATFVDKPAFILWVLTRPTALILNNVLIPFQVAFGLQAIILKNFDQVWHYAWSIILLSIIYCVLWAVGGVAICRNGRAGTEFLQREVFSNFLDKDYEFYNNTYLGALSQQATKLRDAFNEYCQVFINGLTREAVIVISSLAIIAYSSLALAAVTLAALCVVLSFTVISSKWRLRYRRELSETASETAGVINDALGHATTVKSFAAEKYEKERLDKTLNRFIHAQYWSWMSSIPADTGRMLLVAITTAVTLILTARLYQNGSISIAIVALVQLYVIKLVSATYDIADLVKVYEATMSSAHEAIKTYLKQPSVKDIPDAKPLPRTMNYSLDFSELSFRYGDAHKNIYAIKRFNLQIKAGEKVGLVGYSGSGKTTITKLLLRFMDVSSGDIKIGEYNIRDLPQTDLRKHIAYVPQEPLLFHRSVLENIAYGNPKASRKEIIAAAEAAYVSDFIDELPAGYDTLVGERGIKLSGGQRQRVAIARAILKDAPILVLDEATSSLDSRSEKYIQKALWKLMKGRTALVIAHRLSTVQHMDRILIVDKGVSKQIGTHTELLESGQSIYAKLWSHQSGGYLGTSSIQQSSNK